jgi:nucleotide-binding universal stress UspA family protein
MNDNPKPKKDERPIVCGTDFSPLAVEAVNLAAEMARRLDVKLVLLHVEEFRGLALTDPGLFEEVVLKSRQELHRHAERLRKLGTKVEGKILSGSVFDELVDAARRANARLLVVGAVGHGVARRLLIGSVAERVAETSTIPTLVVRPGSRLQSWLRGEHALKVLVGYDFSAEGDMALRWLNKIQALGPCETRVLYLDWPPDEARRVGYKGSLPLTENPKEIQNVLERDLSERVATLLPRPNVTTTVNPGWGRTDAYLFERAYREKIDLLVVGTHRRHGLDRLRFGSVSRSILHRANVTVAVIPLREHRRRSRAKPVMSALADDP